jgi:hypothetical protein
MQQFTKAVCVIDTSSIINLDAIELAGNDILFYIRRFCDVRVCATIKTELDRHTNLVSSREVSYWPSFLSKRRYNVRTLVDDESVLGPFFSSPPVFDGVENAGEYGNARVALESLLLREIGHALFVTDDRRALNGFLAQLGGAFPGIRVWSSADLILYLGAILLKEKKVRIDDVRAALRDVFAATRRAKPWEEFSQKEKEGIIRQSAISADRLRLVQKVVDHWRD